MPIKKCSSKRTLEYICKCRLSVCPSINHGSYIAYTIYPLKKNNNKGSLWQTLLTINRTNKKQLSSRLKFKWL